MNALISIIVPVYNSGKYLSQCLSSLRDQTYTNIEVLLIDDGSSDNSASICKAFAEKDHRFRYYYQNNQGVSAARNYGINLAKGEFVGFCDSDDWVEKDMYEFLMGLVISHQSDVAICSFYRETPTGKDLKQCDHTQRILGPKEAIIEMHRGRIFSGHLCNKIFRKSAIGKLRLDEDISILEDMHFVWRVFLNCSKIVFQNTKKYHYIQHTLSAIHCYRESSWSVQSAAQRMLILMQENYPENSIAAQYTVLFGNITLARKISVAGKLDTASYERILMMINENYSKELMTWFSQSNRRLLRIFRINRHLFNLYVYCTLIRNRLKIVCNSD